MRRVWPVVLIAALGGTGWVFQNRIQKTKTSVGRYLSPAGQAVNVGSFPLNSALSPDGKYFVVTTSGFRQQLTLLRTSDGSIASVVGSNTGTPKDALYFGLAWSSKGHLFVSRGVRDKVTEYRLEGETLTFVRDIVLPKVDNPGTKAVGLHVAGLALSSDEKTLFAVYNQTHAFNSFRGAVAAIEVASGSVLRTTPVGGFPYAVVATKTGQVFVTNERDSTISVLDDKTLAVRGTIRTGAQPNGLLLNKEQSKIFVSNGGSDTISIIDAVSRKVRQTVSLRPNAFRGRRGFSPLGSCLSADEKTLYVALADLNAVAIVDLASAKVRGYVPTGWYPTLVTLSPDGKNLFVASAKGIRPQIPNGNAPAGDRRWANLAEGTLSTIKLDQALSDLDSHTAQVLSNNLDGNATEVAVRKAFVDPGIEHVIYVIKENRTYDQVMGDLPQGNGDPKLCLFPRDVTPNQHALAERFGLYDNFYVCAEVSADGWNWSTAGIANPYVQRNTFTNYSGRGRTYDFEGQNNGVSVELKGLPNVARPTSGYIWDLVLRHGKSMRNYGAFLAEASGAALGPDGKPLAEDNAATQKALAKNTNLDFRKYDLAFPDSEAFLKHGLTPGSRQLLAYGSKGDKSRMTTWLRDYRDLIAKNKVPHFMIVRLGRNHTWGTTANISTPRAMVADNDYAVGQLVEEVSRGPLWRKTAIFILEDDAQAGVDHVDGHRSPVLVISPYSAPAKVDSTFYNTDSVLRTMELLLELPPMHQYDATASAFKFYPGAINIEPFNAILPAREIVGELNDRRAYRSGDSARLISRFEEESAPDFELNDILWGSIRGANSKRPQTPGAVWSMR